MPFNSPNKPDPVTHQLTEAERWIGIAYGATQSSKPELLSAAAEMVIAHATMALVWTRLLPSEVLSATQAAKQGYVEDPNREAS